MSVKKNKVFVGADHAGYVLKNMLLPHLEKDFPESEFIDCGTNDGTSVNYPDFAKIVADRVIEEAGKGVLICGSRIGMSIAANKVNGIRAALAWDVTSARLSREHNEANVLCFGARLIGFEVALDLARVWLKTDFLGGRHADRIELIRKIEEKQ